jgi:hypothetical protein
MTTKHCPTCDREQVVEQPPCVDDHEDCPEWICVACETVIFGGWLAVDAGSARGSGSSAA